MRMSSCSPDVCSSDLGLGLLLLLSLVINARRAGFSEYLNGIVPFMGTILQEVNFLVSFGVLTAVFAMVYRRLPDKPIGWRDVWLGGVVTALLFTIGRSLVALYLGHTGAASPYGAAGSLTVVQILVSYFGHISHRRDPVRDRVSTYD